MYFFLVTLAGKRTQTARSYLVFLPKYHLEEHVLSNFSKILLIAGNQCCSDVPCRKGEQDIKSQIS